MVTPGTPVVDLSRPAKGSVNNRAFRSIIGEHNIAVGVSYIAVSINVATGNPQSPTGEDFLGIIGEFVSTPVNYAGSA